MKKGQVKRAQLATTLARQKRLSKASARDHLDEVVHEILQRLSKGKSVKLPGLGRLRRVQVEKS